MFSKYAVALTGSIASGKSTACTMLKLLGFKIIDTDAIAHELLQTHAKQIVQMFGKSVAKGDIVDRKALGAIVFNDSAQLKKLENFLHPLIFEKVQIAAQKEDVFQKPYLIDIPLFFEKSSYLIAKSIVVYTPKEIQLKRLMQRDGLSEAAAKKRIALQMDIEEKKERATYVIDNSKDLNHLHAQCERVKRELINDIC